MRSASFCIAVAAAVWACIGATAARAAPVEDRFPAEQPAPTSASTPSPTATTLPPPPPDLSGDWSITRSWWRSCPACGMPVVRTSPWTITQTGSAVRVDRGPRGVVSGVAGGGGLLSLEGTEQSGEGVLSLRYSTLRVTADGSAFEGGFNGSERIQNPCGPSPPIVTCFVSGGYASARRVAPITPGPSTTPETATPATATTPVSPSPSPHASVTSAATATRTPRASATTSPTAGPIPSLTPLPPIQRFIPIAGG